ncbi:hypothetical protein GII30_13980 [Gordonia amarae]|uniref:DUF5652 domain-containing protein n=2 Tax=Gordonia amarae TaxID=36821 RepID=G7GRY9_9ACTN|nr:DUF5652 family protein [Gordonia amarae]MCS3879507.1 hypothetical protein [Gordonia amarae]QHN17981.1 hypothetical protein GII35_14295 [Gordonia amarae]QHN22501.1 hypothetical protein GII34_14035 [Gordonia amarae]QHN31366.1 hypothetical protein GII32_14145 [Gordonia amarae]QHN40112.1 hypothetical protein GII30_13980 [Gordonia amarae]
MAKKKWKDLSNQQKGVVVATTAVDMGLRTWAGRDLASRTQEEINGPKWAWGLGLGVVNSVGILPAVYLIWGRKRTSS